jgi:integrase
MTEQLSSTAKDNFLHSCKTADTLRLYQMVIRYFMDYLKLGREEYDRLLEKDPKLITIDICHFITWLSTTHSPATIAAYVAAIQKFYTMNDISLNWKKIKSFIPEHEKVAEDRPYTHSEIKQLYDIATLRNKSLLLLMCSSGVRVGSIPIMRIKDLEPIDKYNIYKINVYPRSKKSSYFTFCTPECRHAIESYLEYRRRFGERITDESPVFRTDYNAHGRIVRSVKECSRIAVMRSMYRMLKDIGMRRIGLENQKYKRSIIMQCHGLRKFFETNAFKVGMDHIYIRRLL